MSNDKLNDIFDQQMKLIKKFHEIEVRNGATNIQTSDFGRLSTRVTQLRLHELYGYLVRELSEAMQLLKNKPWRLTDTPVSQEEWFEEMADAMHFFVEMCITGGMTAEGLHRWYLGKAKINEQRLEGGY